MDVRTFKSIAGRFALHPQTEPPGTKKTPLEAGSGPLSLSDTIEGKMNM